MDKVRHVTGLKQIEKYRLMAWLDANRNLAFEIDDDAMSDQLAKELDIPKLTKHHVGGARRSLGIRKVHVTPKNPAARLEELNRKIDDLACILRGLAIATGNPRLAIATGNPLHAQDVDQIGKLGE